MKNISIIFHRILRWFTFYRIIFLGVDYLAFNNTIKGLFLRHSFSFTFFLGDLLMAAICNLFLLGTLKLVKDARYCWPMKEDLKYAKKYYKENNIPIKDIRKEKYKPDVPESSLNIADFEICMGLQYLANMKISKNEVFHAILMSWILEGYATPPTPTMNLMTPFAFEIILTHKFPPAALPEIEKKLYGELLIYEKGVLTSFFLKEWIDSNRSDKKEQNKKYVDLINQYVEACIETAQNWQENAIDKNFQMYPIILTNKGIKGYSEMAQRKKEYEQGMLPLTPEYYPFYVGVGGKYLPILWEGQNLYSVCNFRYPDVALYSKSQNTNEMFPN